MAAGELETQGAKAKADQFLQSILFPQIRWVKLIIQMQKKKLKIHSHIHHFHYEV